jgi:chaperonin GroEL
MMKYAKPDVVFQPAIGQHMQAGIHKLVNAVRPTLGPRGGGVVLQSDTHPDVPEYLQDAGLIVRRVVQIADPDEDVGAMLARRAIWKVREEAGDGAATAAVLFEAIFDQGLKYVAAGGNAQRLRTCLHQGLQVVLDQLAQSTTRLRGRQKLAQFAYGVCQDRELADYLGEIFDIVGEWGQLEVRKGTGRQLEREYVEGMYWETKPFAREMLTGEGALRVDLDDAAILISNLSIEDPAELVPLLQVAQEAGLRKLVVMAQKMTGPAIALLLANNHPAHFQLAAVEMPFGFTPQQQGLMEDLALLTGGRAIVADSSETLATVKAGDLGRVRKAWVDRTHFGIIGPRGDPHALRTHLAALRAAYAQATGADAQKALRERIGRITTGSATLWVGAVTEHEINQRKDLAERTAEVLRGALREGAVPGGGVGLLACREGLRQCRQASRDPDERMAYEILIRALEEPTRTIIANAGEDAAEVMAAIKLAGPGYGYDVEAGQVVHMAEAGIMDSAAAVRLALINAVSTAAIALTTDVVVHHKRPISQIEP